MLWVSSTKAKSQEVGIWRADGGPLLQTKTLRTICFFKCVSSCSQFVCIVYGSSMQFKGSLVDPLWIKAKLFKMMLSVWGTDWASQAKKDGVKDDIFSLLAFAENLMLFARGLQLVSRPGLIPLLDFYQICLPLMSFELLSSAQFPVWSSIPHLLQVGNVRWFILMKRE